MINFGSETCVFRSLIYTDWILLSILLGHYFAQFRSETAIMRAEFNDFPTSSAFFLDLWWSILCLKRVFLKFLIYIDWISFSILLEHNVVQSRSETANMRAEFNDFPTSYAFFGSFSINFKSETCNVWIHDTYQLDIVVNCFGSLFCSIQIWNYPLWEQNIMISQIHLHFFGSFMIYFVSEKCIFRPLIYTDWISFSILLGHHVVQFRSKTAIMRAEVNDFSTSSAFFLDLSWSILGLKHVFLDPWYLPIGSCFQSFWVIVVQFRSETAIMRAQFNYFPTSSAFFWIFHDQFWVWNMCF